MNLRPAFLLGVLLVSTFEVQADHVCTNSPNEVFVGMSPPSNGVASMPLCRWVETAGPATTPAPPPRVVERWEVFDDRFGAIALATNGIYGTSSDRHTKEEAEEAAMALCVERGGNDCGLRGGGANRNGCGTLAWGGGVSMVEGAATPELSEREALDACKQESGVTCDIIETFCSEPVSRWVYEKPDNWIPKQD